MSTVTKKNCRKHKLNDNISNHSKFYIITTNLTTITSCGSKRRNFFIKLRCTSIYLDLKKMEDKFNFLIEA